MNETTEGKFGQWTSYAAPAYGHKEHPFAEQFCRFAGPAPKFVFPYYVLEDILPGRNPSALFAEHSGARQQLEEALRGS